MKDFNIKCFDCGVEYNYPYEEKDLALRDTEYGEREFVKCIDCGEYAKVMGVVTRTTLQKPAIASIYADKNGKPIAVDVRGNIVDAKDNPYVNDARGWKHSGHKDVQGYGNHHRKKIIK